MPIYAQLCVCEYVDMGQLIWLLCMWAFLTWGRGFCLIYFRSRPLLGSLTVVAYINTLQPYTLFLTLDPAETTDHSKCVTVFVYNCLDCRLELLLLWILVQFYKCLQWKLNPGLSPAVRMLWTLTSASYYIKPQIENWIEMCDWNINFSMEETQRKTSPRHVVSQLCGCI